VFDFNIYDHGFNLYSFLRIEPHLYVFSISVDGPDHGARARRIETGMARGGGKPRREFQAILAENCPCGFYCPPFWAPMILLFGNAFGAYATAYALTGGRLPIITIQIGAQVRGDVLHNPISATPWQWAWSLSWQFRWRGIHGFKQRRKGG